MPSSHTANTPRSMPVASPALPAYGAPPPPGSVPDTRAFAEGAGLEPVAALATDRSLASRRAIRSYPSPPRPSERPLAQPAPDAGARPRGTAGASTAAGPRRDHRAFPPAAREGLGAPVYAMKVRWRQFELRQDLASLRNRRSPDVLLYERALRTHDAKTFALGLAITCAGLALASFVFFLPVILRFLRDPD